MNGPELLVERRKLKRSRTLWRAACVLVAAGSLALLFGRSELVRHYTPYVAELRLSGIIFDDTDLIEALEDAMDESSAKALVLRIDSPGGTVVGGESFYRTIRKIAETKPVVAVLGEVAASGGYMVAIAADHIVAREGTITGSIGVILQTTDLTGLMGMLGVKAEAIKSAPLKAVPSPLEPLTEAGRAATRTLVEDMYDMFVGMVAERRGMERPQALAPGRRAGLHRPAGQGERPDRPTGRDQRGARLARGKGRQIKPSAAGNQGLARGTAARRARPDGRFGGAGKKLSAGTTYA